ncbi:MAG: CHAT domain-containing protein [Burkholderiales bacterium]
MPNRPVEIHLIGREADRKLPPLLTPATRAAGRNDDEFLPSGYLVPTAAFDVGPAARDVGAASKQSHTAGADEVVVLELADGSTLITSAQRLRESLALTHPELIADDGSILLEKLRADGAAPGRGFGEAIGGLVSKVYAFAVGAAPDAIIDEALSQLKNPLELGVSWLGTKVLMAAIEKRLDQQPGLYRWVGATGKPADLAPVDLNDPKLPPPSASRPMLVFVHGTASSTLGSFGDLRTGDRDLWGMLAARFTGGIFAFEHRTLSQSPIENAIGLANSLPQGAQVCLVSHSRGGLVADLMCLGDFDSMIDRYAYAFEGTGDADPDEAKRVRAELAKAHEEQRAQLRTLANVLRERRITVQRYVRAASPASGTLLASGNLDVFLSGILSLIGLVPFFFGSPVYSAFKRVVVEVAKNRTNAHLVPGIEAMLPDSPMARLLRDAPVRPNIAMGIIAGDIQGGNMLRRLGVMLTDFLLFDNEDNDLVVNTTSMLAGIAPKSNARVLFDRGADVSHFRYFANIDTRAALRDWLIVPDTAALTMFRGLPTPAEFADALAASAASRDATAADRPVVVVLPGVMGSHLEVKTQMQAQGTNGDRVWFDPADIAAGGLSKIAWGQPSVEAEALFAMFYGKVCKYLADSHRVEPFPYDWRQPMDVLAERLGEFLDRLMKQTQQPIRLLAHSMGGLVVRATIHKRRSVIDALMAREGARLIMLGTPNQGAHSMVENVIGKGDTLRTLVRLDLKHDMQGVLDIVAGFRGALQLLPKPGFVDMFQGQDGGGGKYAFQKAETWVDLKSKVTDFWFGNQRAGTPGQAVLDESSWLWAADGLATPTLPSAYEAKTSYVFGVAPNTACGVREEDDGKGGTRLKIVGTTRGDGTVSWESGRINGIGHYYYLPAAHGDLPSTEEYFPALADLLTAGTTARLSMTPPAVRAIQQPLPVSYDAGPPTADDPDALQRGLMGGSKRNRVPPRPKRRLEVTVKAMDLRFISQPIMVGHYERDPIAGAESLIDRELLGGDLSERYSLGLYAGGRGTATVVLRVPNDIERQRGSLSGAVVAGLGSYDRALSPSDLTEAVRTGALRYLLQVIDVLGKADREVPLASLLMGYNSSANLTVAASVEALVRGVMEANAKFFETTRLNIRIARLDIVELYIDTAISAVYALRQLGPQLTVQATKHGTMLVCRNELVQGEGLRQRLFDDRSSSYWPRLIIADADRGDENCPPGCLVVSTKSGDAASDAAKPAAAPIADRLRFTYVGQRARAESVALQRQPGLIEQLVAQQIHNPTWNEDFGRMLFQLMVPHDFKDAARQLDRVVLVVDAYTANLPWELMLADDPSRASDDKLPLALRTAVVRQLSTWTYRPQVRQGVERRALVIGNPSVAGFTAAFPLINGRPTQAPPALPGAQAEAEATAVVLGSMGYTVESVIGDYQPASDVLTRLYSQPWRILHISAHGVFDLPHVDGRHRSGVLLSGGLLITAAEIAAMEIVPEVVFLNCCHLGQMTADDGGGRGGNKLAASVARELIEVGVRCVVVAGWAVNDESAKLFGQSFYEQLLLRRRPFGDAVFEARKAVWQAHPEDITWGAFQAYGEPGWLAEPRAPDGPGANSGSTAASPEELLDDLARRRADLSRRRENLSDAEMRGQADAIAAMLKLRCPPAWEHLPQLQSALGRTWFELGQLERARDCLLAAVQAVDTIGLVPIHDIEKLASVEARLGDQRAQAELAPGHRKGVPHTAEALIDMSLKRLEGLDALVETRLATGLGADPLQPAAPYGERAALRGSAWKRKAALQARRLLKGHLGAAERDLASREMVACIEKAVAAYQSAEGSPGSSRFSTYHALNRLALDALTEWESPAARDAAIELAQQCRKAAAQGFSITPTLWDAITQPEALLVERMIDGSLGRAGDAGRAVFEDLARAYGDAMLNMTIKPSQLDAMVSQMELLSRLCDALSLVQFDDEVLARMATQLIELAQRVQPGRTPRDDRPVRAKGDAKVGKGKAVAAAPAKRVAKSKAKRPSPATATKPGAASKKVAKRARGTPKPG